MTLLNGTLDSYDRVCPRVKSVTARTVRAIATDLALRNSSVDKLRAARIFSYLDPNVKESPW